MAKMTRVTNVAIEWLTLPELSGAAQHLITFVSGEALPRMHDRAHRESASAVRAVNRSRESLVTRPSGAAPRAIVLITIVATSRKGENRHVG